MYLKRLGGRKGRALEDLINEPLIVELRNGKVYGGRLDEYYYNGGGVIALYSCKLLDKKSHKWADHDIMMKFEGKLMADPMPDFWIADTKEIFVLPEEYRICNPSSSDLEDALQIYIDPHYRPLTGVLCNWDVGEGWKTEKDHTVECEARLHEALSFLVTEADRGISLNPKNKDENRRRFEDAYAYIRRRLLMYGARIP